LSPNTKGPEIIKVIFAFFSVSLLLFGGNLLIISYSQSSQLQQQQQPQLQQQQQPQLQQPQLQQPQLQQPQLQQPPLKQPQLQQPPLQQQQQPPLQQQQQPLLKQQGQSVNMTRLLPGGNVTPSRQLPIVGLPSPVPPQQHISSESEVGSKPCVVPLNRFLGIKSADVGRLFPEWKSVNDPVNRIVATLEGRVTDAEVAFDDVPFSHYSHDFNFQVLPDTTSDKRFTNLLGTQIDPKTGQQQQQKEIEVEWETGLAAGNSGNPLAALNIRGESGGFFSAGHHRGDYLSFWPTPGDRVHVEGLWIWDRGHPPAKTEIHPPRLVATERHLPSLVSLFGGRDNTFGTEINVFASGDTGAYYNNRPGAPAFVQKVPMNVRDYTFTMNSIIPVPSPTSQLKWSIVKSAGDTFPGNPTITKSGVNGVTITIPWRSSGAPDTAVFARTIYLYWEGGGAVKGTPPGYPLNSFAVTLDNVKVNDDEDPLPFNDGEWRLFAQVGSKWFFLNEIPRVSNILGGSEGATYGDFGDGESSVINRGFQVYLPPGASFRIHTDGWEADGIDNIFGRLVDQNHVCDPALKSWLNNNMFSYSVGLAGCRDDPVGKVNRIYTTAGATAAAGQVIKAASAGSIFTEDPCGKTNPNNDYVMQYHIKNLGNRWSPPPVG
jgi:hypothetical protein